MGDSDLEEIRRQRLAQLQSQYRPSGDDGGDRVKAQEEQVRAQEDAKNSILSQILDQQARARLNTLMVVKPDKGKMVESMLVRMAQTGQIRSRLSEEELINLLESVNQQLGTSKPAVKFDRRRAALDSDDDL